MKTTIIVRYDAGWGNHVAIRGGAPLDWESGQTMESVDHCTWQLELELEDPLEFKPLLNDSIWAFGHRDYRVEPGQTLRLYPHFQKTPGWADAIGYIPFKGRDVTVRLYTPPGYKENAERRYPVLYCLDGETLFEPQGHREWHMDDALNALIQARAIEPLLVVGVDFAERGADKSCVKPAEFAAFTLKLKETIDRTYPTLPEGRNTGLLGASTGGLMALWLGRKHPESFGRVAALSPSFWWANEEVLKEQQVVDGKQQQVYLDCEGASETVNKLAETLRSEGWVEGDNLAVDILEDTPHKGDLWAGRIGASLRFLFPWSGH